MLESLFPRFEGQKLRVSVEDFENSERVRFWNENPLFGYTWTLKNDINCSKNRALLTRKADFINEWK